jgi:DNA-binding MarR family transcriptional regulator
MAEHDPQLDLATLAFIAGSAANEVLLRRIRDAGHPGLRISHGYVFQRLIAGQPTVGELAASLGVTQQAASKAARELEDLGYVDRYADAADGRVTRLVLTAKGTDAVAVARRVRDELQGDLAETINARDLAAARRALTALLDLVGGAESVRTRSVRPWSI